MIDIDTIPDEPPTDSQVPTQGRFLSSRGRCGAIREIVRSLTDRDFRARYKQAVLGFAWAIINPLILVLVFTFTLGKIHQRSHRLGVPTRSGHTPASSPGRSSPGRSMWAATCLVNNQPLLNKVNFPREAFPVSCRRSFRASTPAISFVGLVAFFAYFRFLPKETVYWVPVIFLVQLAFTVGCRLILSIVVVYLRDLRQITPILIQIGLFATPVAYQHHPAHQPSRGAWCTAR